MFMVSLFGCLFLVLLFIVGTVAAQEDQPQYRVIGYFSSWGIYDREYFVTDIAADKLTHINYAFFLISENGECILGDEWADTQFPYPGDQEDEELRGNSKQLNLLKESHPGLQTLMSIGGWSGSDLFSDVALTDESRQKFVQSCIAMMTQYGFNGIDIDWEYPTGGGEVGNKARPEDKQNFTLLLAEFRRQFDELGSQRGQHYLLTIAAPSTVRQYANIELDKIIASLDWINVMTYDFSGPWSETTGFNAPLYPDAASPALATNNADNTVRGYLAAGVPPEKLVLGVPFYGRGWGGVEETNDGLYQPYSGFSDGEYEYSDLVVNYVGKFQRFWNDTAKVPWLYDADTGTMITYDDPESLAFKANYVKEQQLGGVMIWELASDDHSHSLLNAVYDTLAAE
jgi:chitinase